MACGKCGREHLSRYGGAACAGHRKSYLDPVSGERVFYPKDERPACRKPPMLGQTVCSAHGGRARQAKAAGQARETERKATELMRTFGGPIETTATEALLDTVKWTAGYVAWLRERVAATKPKNLIWGTTKRKTGGDDHGTTEQAGPNVWLALLGEWQDRLVKVCAEAIKAGIEERKVRLAEQQGALVADVIRRVLDELELTAEQAARSGEVVVKHLRLLTG